MLSACPVTASFAVAQSAVHPPSTTKLVPVTSADASEARNKAAPIRSSTRPIRPSLILASTDALNSGSSKKGLVSGVSIKVGAIVFERMPWAARSSAEGHGLGLALVRSIAERHGLSVRCEDAAPGARFIVSREDA